VNDFAMLSMSKNTRNLYTGINVLYGYKTWPLTFRKEGGLNVNDNRMLKRILHLKRDEITGGWRKLHNDELHINYN
jgi:hypothetical protein